jgi:putative transposase
VQPNPIWVAQQARNVTMWAEDEGLAMPHVVRDRDGKFHGQFEAVLKAQGTEVVQIQYRAPNMNAFAERWAQTLEVECLDHFVVVAESQLNYIMSEYVEHYNTERPHQGRGNVPLDELSPCSTGKIECKRRLGGLLKHYYRRAA